MRPERTAAQAGVALTRLAVEFRVPLTDLSKMIGRHDDYLGRFVRDGVPGRLRSEEIARLATFFDADPWELGGITPPRPARTTPFGGKRPPPR